MRHGGFPHLPTRCRTDNFESRMRERVLRSGWHESAGIGCSSEGPRTRKQGAFSPGHVPAGDAHTATRATRLTSTQTQGARTATTKRIDNAQYSGIGRRSAASANESGVGHPSALGGTTPRLEGASRFKPRGALAHSITTGALKMSRTRHASPIGGEAAISDVAAPAQIRLTRDMFVSFGTVVWWR